MVVRPNPTKKHPTGLYTSEWLKGQVDRADAEAEANALLADPRDTICAVYLWDDRLQCFNGKWKHDRTAIPTPDGK